MRLTAQEILLIVVIISILIVGALTKRYRDAHSPANHLPEPISGARASAETAH